METALIDRRTFLRTSLAAGAAVGLGAAVWLPPAAAGRLVLSSRESELVASVSEAMFPGAPFPLSGLEAGVVDKVDALLDDGVEPLQATGFRYLLRTLEWGSLASRGARFSDLPVDVRRDVLDAWARPGVLPRRVASDTLRMVMGMAYFSHPEIRAHIGWRATCSGGVA